MKRKTLVLSAVVVVVGLAAWLMRFPLALDYLRGRGGSGGAFTSLAWSVLDDFADNQALEAFVREQLADAAETALTDGLSWDFESAPLLEAAEHVYARQPDRLDAVVVAAALVVECSRGCVNHASAYEDAPSFRTSTWSDETRQSDAFRLGSRRAAIALATRRPASNPGRITDSLAGLVIALADTLLTPDPELATSIATFTLATSPGERETRWLAAAMRGIAGPAGVGAAWATALAKAPAADLSLPVWETSIDALKESRAVVDESHVAALLAHCARRSEPPARVDDGCVDLGLAWGAAWTDRLRAWAAEGRSDAGIVRALLQADHRERTRTWRDVIAEWRQLAPQSPADDAHSERGPRTSAMQPSAFRPSFPRGEARDVERLLAGGPPAFAAVAVQYRTTRHPAVLAAAAFVLSNGAPQLLSSAVMDRIEHFRPLALSFTIGADEFDRTAYDVEGARVAAGLLALAPHGKSSTRVYPLILALSIQERGFSEYAATVLRETLSADEFADALFGFLAIRDRYLVIEVDAYRDALTSYTGAGPAIERNLARLIGSARGRPEGVPWILKVIGLSALAKVGGSSAWPVLDRYAPDTGSYLEVTTPVDVPDDDALPTRTVTRRFDELVACARRHIDVREGRGDDGAPPEPCTNQSHN